jgi:predicted small lipoprotein YifL
VRRPTVALLLACAALAGCGDNGPTDADQVRATVQSFGNATAAKDYKQMCDGLLAPKLVQEIEATGLACDAALAKGLGDVKDPKLTIGTVTVNGLSATADVRTSATGQPPSRDTLKLTKVSGSWRVASLGDDK